MAYAKQKVTFPCGLKIENVISGWGIPELGNVISCPLHGSNCKTKK